MRLIVIAFAVLALAACEGKTTASVENARPDFRDALDAHLAAVAAKDVDAFAQTLTASEDLLLIFPDGQLIGSTEGVAAFHTEWFADANWRMTPEIVKLMEGADMSSALIRYDYRDTPEGEPRSSWLLLIFQLEAGGWRLIHDQNTRIAK